MKQKIFGFLLGAICATAISAFALNYSEMGFNSLKAIGPSDTQIDLWDAVRGGIKVAEQGGGGGATNTPATTGSNAYAIKRDNLTTASINLPFGFTSKKILIRAPSSNTDEICVSWSGGTAVCPAANTAGNGRLAPGNAIMLDEHAATSLSFIAASGTQTVQVSAWN